MRGDHPVRALIFAFEPAKYGISDFRIRAASTRTTIFLSVNESSVRRMSPNAGAPPDATLYTSPALPRRISSA